MLQKDSLFRRSDNFFRSPTPLPPAPPAGTPEPAKLPEAARHPAPVTDKSEERKEAKLIVGPDIKMKGVEVSDCDTLVVEGRIEATIDARVLQIAQNGVFSGTVAVDTAEIHGRLEGDLTVRKQLVIHSSGARSEGGPAALSNTRVTSKLESRTPIAVGAPPQQHPSGGTQGGEPCCRQWCWCRRPRTTRGRRSAARSASAASSSSTCRSTAASA